MEKELIRLQLFADELPAEATTASNAGSGEKTEESKAADTTKAADGKGKAKYTDADVDEILNRKFAEWQKKKEKEVSEAQKLAEMDAQQKAEYERDQLKKELDEYKRKDSLAEMTKTARKMLSDSGVTVPDEVLAMLVTTDADETKKAIDGFSKAFKEAVETAVKERLRGDPPKKGSGASGGGTMTKAQIMAIRDPELRQQKMLENKHLFNF